MGRVMKTIKQMFGGSNDKKYMLTEDNQKEPPKTALNEDLQQNILHIKNTLGNSPDIVIREVRLGQGGAVKAGIIYADGLADKKVITDFILESLMLDVRDSEIDREISSTNHLIQVLKDYALTIGDVKDITDFETLYNSVLSGDAVILLDGENQAIAASSRGWKDRGVTEATTQNIVRGPREAFLETLRTNTALVRRKIKDPNLWMETRQIGRVTKTDVAVMYIKGIVDDKVVEEVRTRLDRIDIDSILESGYIEELIQDETFTPFPTLYNTERPDVVAAGLLEGRVAIFVDGTPFVLLAPALFVQFYQSAEDYYHRSDFGLLRLLRYVSLAIALLLPSLYVAVTTFNQEILPTTLLISLAAQREGIPFPAFLEALIMETTFEILREAGVRMPKAVGQTVSIVGALVIGQAAVEAGLVSPAMVIVVSLTAVANFVIPSFTMGIAIRVLRFALMGLAASFGLFGIAIGLVAVVLHLCSLRSFGVPYMAPMAPFILRGQKDAILRVPWWAMYTRPLAISQKNKVRENTPQPKPPDNQ